MGHGDAKSHKLAVLTHSTPGHQQQEMSLMGGTIQPKISSDHSNPIVKNWNLHWNLFDTFYKSDIGWWRQFKVTFCLDRVATPSWTFFLPNLHFLLLLLLLLLCFCCCCYCCVVVVVQKEPRIVYKSVYVPNQSITLIILIHLSRKYYLGSILVNSFCCCCCSKGT